MRRRFGKPHTNHERWLVSYADFITLLFAFFVVLYAFAKADERRQTQVSAAIDSAFTSLSLTPGAVLPSNRIRAAGTPILSSVRLGTSQLVTSRQVVKDLERIKSDLQA